MDAWNQFLKTIAGQTHLTLVGPLLKKPFHVQGPAVYVDGGARFRDKKTEFPNIAVGDGDSSPLGLEVCLPAEKNYSDLAFVLRGLPASLRDLELHGFLGGRRDHELIGFGEVHKFLRARPEQTTVRFEQSVFAFSSGKLKLIISGVFSVVVFEPAVVSISGACAFTLTPPASLEAMSSHGLSNKGMGEVTIASSGPCFVFLN